MIRILYPHPALLLEEDGGRHVVISDLHIGFEERFASSGVRMESSSRMMLETLTKILDREKPDSLIMLGDVKDSIDSINRTEWREVPSFLEALVPRVQVRIVPGNHDGGLLPLTPKDVRIEDLRGVLIGNTGMCHGHTLVSKRFSEINRLIIGHLHPIYSRKGIALSGSQVWVMLKLSRQALLERSKDDLIEIVVLPSFNRELGAIGFSPYRQKMISPIMRRAQSAIQDAVIMTLDGEIIGDKTSLHYTV